MKEAKRIISLFTIVCMLVCMVPMMIPSWDVHAMFGVAKGRASALSGTYYKNDSAVLGEIIEITDPGEGEASYNLKIDSANNTIIMRDLNYSGDFIYIASDVGCTIEAIGTNNITTASIGIFYETTDISTELRFIGTGIININVTEKASGLPFGLKSAGILSAGDVLVEENVTLNSYAAGDETETSGSGSLSYGICATNASELAS
ncbi:MAG: hypothetical protein J5622_03985, partial [Firmicutes bacterium]|nr:hypothetical protein [Bacillota bacterium]